MDRQITDVGVGGVWDLKKNFALIELMEKLQLGTVTCGTPTDHTLNQSSTQPSKVETTALFINFKLVNFDNMVKHCCVGLPSIR